MHEDYTRLYDGAVPLVLREFIVWAERFSLYIVAKISGIKGTTIDMISGVYETENIFSRVSMNERKICRHNDVYRTSIFVPF